MPAGTPIDAVNPNTGLPYWTATTASTVGDKQSTRPKDLAINDAILTQAYEDVPLSGYDNVKFYILPTSPDDQPGSYGLTTSSNGPTSAGEEPALDVTPDGFGYVRGYLTGSTTAPNLSLIHI